MGCIDCVAPGDIILIKRTVSFAERMRELTGSPWNQVGIVIQDGVACRPAVLLSTKIPIAPDCRTGQLAYGVQILRLNDLSPTASEPVALRSLSPALPKSETLRLKDFTNRVHGLPFNNSALAAVR